MAALKSGQLATVLAFAAIVVIAGGNGVAIRYSNRELAPFFGAGLRFGLAALFFVALVLATHKPWPTGRRLLGSAAYGLLTFALGFGLLYQGLRGIQAGLAQVLLATVPLAALLLAAAHGLEAFRWRRLAGTLVAVAGVAIISAGHTSAAGPLPAALAVLLALAAAACIGEGIVAAKLFPPMPIATMSAVGMAAGSAALFVASWVAGERWTLPAAPSTWGALAYLVLLGTAAVFGLFLFVLQHWSASATADQFLFIPIPAVLASAWLDGERLTPSLLLGGLAVVGGVWWGAKASVARPVAAPPAGALGPEP